jgi:hypothetical protein
MWKKVVLSCYLSIELKGLSKSKRFSTPARDLNLLNTKYDCYSLHRDVWYEQVNECETKLRVIRKILVEKKTPRWRWLLRGTVNVVRKFSR